MCLAQRFFALAVVAGMCTFLASPAASDWHPDDPYKIHFPQLPDGNGWEVNAISPLVLADDWLCTETGPVSDIHFWFSIQGEEYFIPGTMTVHASIHADIPASGQDYSRPGDLLWEDDFSPGSEPGQYVVNQYSPGAQGWYDPSTGSYNDSDHSLIWQANITRIPTPFTQQKGTIYWLDLSLTTDNGATLGWLTADLEQYPEPYTGVHFNDDAVWHSGDGVWHELTDPNDGHSLDLAFVITPEPGTLVLLITAGAGLLAFAWRRRSPEKK